MIDDLYHQNKWDTVLRVMRVGHTTLDSIMTHKFHLLELFSSQWSYGVTVWEIFSGGMVPYPGTSPYAVVQILKDGERLPKPYNAACTEEM